MQPPNNTTLLLTYQHNLITHQCGSLLIVASSWHAYLPLLHHYFVLCIIGCLLFAILFCLDCEEDQGGYCDCADCTLCSDQGK